MTMQRNGSAIGGGCLPGSLYVMGIGLLALILYVAGYFTLSNVYRGRFKGQVIEIRLFQEEWQLSLWQPLVRIEKLIRRGDFYGQVHRGASLPPADE